jgi:two-component system chemotaxis sensor kinase CheA
MDSNPGFSPELRKELLDDFYAECDELLTSIKQNVAVLEEGAVAGTADAANTESLFRHVHTLKGISTIVGLRPAEEMAHAVESVLRGVTTQTLALRPVDIDALVAAVHAIEQTVIAHRGGQAGPDPQPVIAALRRIASAGATDAKAPRRKKAPAAAPAGGTNPVADARKRGLHLYLFTFVPSPELDRRGINVGSVRQRLEGLGEILLAAPRILGKGAIAFEFQVALREKLADLEGLKGEGIAAVPLEAEVPAGTAADPGAQAEILPLASSQMVRVDLARLDNLMRITGELIVHRFRLEDRLAQPLLGRAELNEISVLLGRSLREMRGAISQARMVPIGEIFARIPFVVRDLSRGSEKRARVSLEGSQIEVDKYLVERLKEPLLHLVRNAFSHGIETPAERTAAGKPPEAAIVLSAASAGEHVVIRVRDDGRGVDPEAVAARARARGIAVPTPLDPAGLLALLCTPGFSTRDEADLAAGRGVGMAIVASTVRELGGTLTLDSRPGAGTEFALRLPLTLSIADAIIVSVAESACAIPQSAVNEIVQVPGAEVRAIQRSEVVPYRGGLLPIVRLRATFGLEPNAADLLTLLVVSSERGATGLVVDRVLSQREVVIRPLLDPLVQVEGVSGATELGDGRPILILDPDAITAGVVRITENPVPAASPIPAESS